MDKLNRWLTLLTNLGVVAGIIFLAIELNQNTKATIAAASEGVTNQSLEYFALGMDNEVISKALYKQSTELELDGFERDQLRRHQYYNFRVFQNVYLQYRRGYYDENEWNAYRRLIASRLASDPIALAMWNDTAGGWDAYFESEVEIIREMPSSEHVRGFN